MDVVGTAFLSTIITIQWVLQASQATMYLWKLTHLGSIPRDRLLLISPAMGCGSTVENTIGLCRFSNRSLVAFWGLGPAGGWGVCVSVLVCMWCLCLHVVFMVCIYVYMWYSWFVCIFPFHYFFNLFVVSR